MKQPAETTNFLVLDKPACAGRLEQYTSTLWRSIHGHAELVSASVFLFFLFFLIPTKAYASTEYVTVYAGLPAKIINKVVDKVEASESTNAKEYITVYAGNYEIQKIGDEVTEKVYTNNPSGGSIVKTRPITSLRSASGGEAIPWPVRLPTYRRPRLARQAGMFHPS